MGKLPREGDVLAAVQRSVIESHYGYAPGRASREHVLAQLALVGYGRGEKTRATADELLGRLVKAGALRQVEVMGPAGQTSGDWFEVATSQ